MFRFLASLLLILGASLGGAELAWAQAVGGGGAPGAPSVGGPAPSNSGFILEKPAALDGTIFGEGLTVAFPRIWDTLVAIAGAVFVVLLLVGGFQYLTAAGNDDQLKKAKQLLFDAVIGLVLVVVAWPVGIYALNVLGLADKAFKVNGTSLTKPQLQVIDGAGNLSAGSGSGSVTAGGTGDAALQNTPGLTTAPLTVRLTTGAPNVRVTATPVDKLITTTGTTDLLTTTGSTDLPTTTGSTDISTRPADSGSGTGGGRRLVPVSGLTGPDGTARIEVPANVTLEVEVEGNPEPVGTTIAEPNQENVITVDPGGKLVTVQVTVTDNKTLKGVEGYTFRAYLGSKLIAEQTTNAAGQGTVSLPAGTSVSITSATSSQTLYTDTVPTDNGRNWTVFVSRAAAPGQSLALHYIFVEPTGNFAAGKAVEIYDVGDPTNSGDDRKLTSATTGNDGLVTVTGLKPGTRLMVKYNGQLGCGVTVPDLNASQSSCTLY